MNDFIKETINEAFKSKKQQRYFYAQANNKDLPKKERKKWSKWAKEFSDKTNFKKIPEVAEAEIDEIVDELGNIKRNKKPTDFESKGTTSKNTTDVHVKQAQGSMGIHGVHGTHTSLRYWAESDQSKVLGFDKTIGQDASKEEAEEYFEKELGMDEPEAKERMDALGYDDELPNDKLRLVENPKKYIEEYIDSILSKRTKENDIVEKDDNIDNINPIIAKQIKSLKNSIKSNNISINDVIKLLKDNE